jgi:transcriptional/translational regulatory protein YebC/TACO1
MSGHSKWHNIQKTKGAQDAKRAQAFTKIAREMIVAVKEGGSGDPVNNSRLAAVVTKAKAVNMPSDNIKRTIEKALGSGNVLVGDKVNISLDISAVRAVELDPGKHHPLGG